MSTPPVALFLPNIALKHFQGDVFVGVTIHEQLGNDPIETTTHPLLLLSHGCMIDKPATVVLHVCRIAPVAALSSDHMGNVRRSKVKDAMYLGDVPQLGEMYAHFGYWHRVLREDLNVARAQGRCVASMTVEGRLILQEHLWRFHARRLRDEAPPTDPDEV